MKHDEAWWRTMNTKPMADRQIDQLIGLAQGIVADGIVNQTEAEVLQNWLRANRRTNNLQVSRLLDLVEAALRDGVLDDDESRELHDALMSWTGGGETALGGRPPHPCRSTRSRAAWLFPETSSCSQVPVSSEPGRRRARRQSEPAVP